MKRNFLQSNSIHKIFEFSPEELQVIADIIAQYPKGKEQSAILPILDIAQRKNDNWLSKEVIEAVSQLLQLKPIKVWEIASFYTMFNLQPIGKYHVQICRTLPCYLRGAEKNKQSCLRYLQTNLNEMSKDSLFTISEVECLGACVNAPVMQINDKYYENLDEVKTVKILAKLKAKVNE